MSVSERKIANTIETIFRISQSIRYVAILHDCTLKFAQRHDVANASETESDRYEELLVNPTLLHLAKARGDIDCGGARFVVVGYGNFMQLVIPLSQGHASICFEYGSDPISHVDAISKACANGLSGA